jgi:autotransporter strand-loop-strand O-heptosyltransferase
MKTKALGDTIGASPYFEKYRIESRNEVYVSCHFHDFFQPIYPKINFVPFGFKNTSLFSEFFDLDFLFDVPLQKGFSDQLGLEYEEIRPRIHFESRSRPIKEKFVGIAFQSTCQSRYWNRDGGWDTIFKKLRQNGLTPVGLDHHNSFGIPGSFNNLPASCQDKTGLPLDRVIQYIEHCEFFMGLTTGLSWLAHAMGKHVVLISGSTHDWCEPTKDLTRVINKDVCHGCFNEPHKTPFDAGNWMWCPHHGGTENQFICSKSITPETVWQKMQENKLI